MNDPRPRHTGVPPSDGSSRRLPSGAFGMPAGNAIIATFVAIAMVAVGSWLGVMDEGQGGDASSFDALAVDGTTTTEPGSATSVVGAGSTDGTGSTDVADPTDPAAAGTDPPATAAATTVATVPATTPDAGRTPTEDDPLRLYIAGVLLWQFIPDRAAPRLVATFSTLPAVSQGIIIGMVMVVCYRFGSIDEFIYFQF